MRAPSSLILAPLGVLLLVALAALVAPDWVAREIVEPWRAQADPAPGLQAGYTPASLVFWALIGAGLAVPAFHLLFIRWRLEPDRRFFLALAPLLLFGPLYHALLSAGALPVGSVWAYAAAEPPVYLTVAALALAGLAGGRLLGRPHEGLLLVGCVATAAALVLAFMVATGSDLLRAGGLLAVSLASAALLVPLGRRAARGLPVAAVFAVIWAHALDGATTWFTLRDPFRWGFEGFRESNPIAERLVFAGNGWPYFVLKLALPVALLALVRMDDRERPADEAREPTQEERLQAFLLFAVFVLGFGPGMSNLLKVVLG